MKILQSNNQYKDTSDIFYCTFAHASEVYAVSDLGVPSFSPAVNEDAIGIVSTASFLVLADGMGGEGDGDKAAHILVQELCETPDEKEHAIQRIKQMYTEHGLSPRAGAVFIAAQIYLRHGEYLLEETHCGDALLFIVGKDHTLRYLSESDAVVAQDVRDKKITKDEALYSPIRHFAGRAITHNPAMLNTLTTMRVPVEKGDIIYMMSDGIADNFTPNELLLMSNLENIPESIDTIMHMCTKRMMSAETVAAENRKEHGVYSDGFLSEPKKDNRSLVIIRV